ncbi:MAG: ABC transporter permease, partial [Gemmatimonadales bacterium]
MSESIAISRQSSLVSDLRTVVRDIWGARDLLIQLTRRDITIRYKQAVMGMAWAVLMPMLIVISGLLIRLAMSRYAGRTLAPDTMAGIAVKSVPWAFFVGAIGFATPSLTGNINLVTKIYFPREVLTLSTVLAQTKDMAIGLVVMGLALPLFFGVSYHWTVLWVPLL